MLKKIVSWFKNMVANIKRLFGLKQEVVEAPKENLYCVELPNNVPVILRAKNETEVRALVREANFLTRLPAGTKVKRLNI